MGKALRALAFSSMLLVFWSPDQAVAAHRTVKCESRGGHYTYCATYTTGRVRLERQLSDTPCRRYSTWGADGDGSGVWVRNGCRGVFVIEPSRPPHPGGWQGAGRTVTCKSDHYNYKHCFIGGRGGQVRLERQLSDTRCVRGMNWGVDRNGVWVTGGCAAVFSVR